MKREILALLLVGLLVTAMNDSSSNAFYENERLTMVERTIARRGVKDEHVLNAMRKIPRHLFVPEPLRDGSYEDKPQSIGEGQTISQPYIVAYMTELAEIASNNRALEIGTGSGYQAAVLAELAKEVYTIEIVPSLGKQAKAVLTELGYKNIFFKIGDGYQGWVEHAPYDAIIVTAAAPVVPQALKDQLKPGGRLIIPVEQALDYQVIEKWIKMRDGSFQIEEKIPVRFVPLVPSDDDPS